jgi:hypothetical protein
MGQQDIFTPFPRSHGPAPAPAPAPGPAPSQQGAFGQQSNLGTVMVSSASSSLISSTIKPGPNPNAAPFSELSFLPFLFTLVPHYSFNPEIKVLFQHHTVCISFWVQLIVEKICCLHSTGLTLSFLLTGNQGVVFTTLPYCWPEIRC